MGCGVENALGRGWHGFPYTSSYSSLLLRVAVLVRYYPLDKRHHFGRLGVLQDYLTKVKFSEGGPLYPSPAPSLSPTHSPSLTPLSLKPSLSHLPTLSHPPPALTRWSLQMRGGLKKEEVGQI